MTPRIWAEIVAAHQDAERLIAAAFGDRAARPDLEALRARLRRRLDELLAALSPPASEEDAVSALVPLVLLLDERVEGRLTRLDPEEPPAWPALQRDLFPAGDGGDVFYEQAAALLRLAAPPALVVGAYLFCLRAGFEGRLVDAPAQIPRWKERLAARLPPAAPLVAEAAQAASRKARPRWHHVAAVVGALLALQLVLLAITRGL
ncbi:DotU family type IV/VI secretion system protein [Sorangium sp. So ce887]|uniref:DotU family type IV/VI secretion system protein n=1 Tax=Sorangium sp. So ce887 TaxID=3133324 RepID=UPI003F5FD13C